MVIESEAQREAREAEEAVIEVRPTIPDEEANEAIQDDFEEPRQQQSDTPRESPPQDTADGQDNLAGKSSDAPPPHMRTQESEQSYDGVAPGQKLLVEPPAEQGGDFSQPPKDRDHPDPSVMDQRRMSRAERRKLIRDEIYRLSHYKEPRLYQRRLAD